MRDEAHEQSAGTACRASRPRTTRGRARCLQPGASGLLDAAPDEFRACHIVAVPVHMNPGNERRVVDRDDVYLAFTMKALKNQRVEERIERMDYARRDAVREFGAVHIWITPQELPLDATVRVAPPDRNAGAKNLDVALPGGDAIHGASDRVPLDLGTVERMVERDTTVPVRLAPDVSASR